MVSFILRVILSNLRYKWLQTRPESNDTLCSSLPRRPASRIVFDNREGVIPSTESLLHFTQRDAQLLVVGKRVDHHIQALADGNDGIQRQRGMDAQLKSMSCAGHVDEELKALFAESAIQFVVDLLVVRDEAHDDDTLIHDVLKSVANGLRLRLRCAALLQNDAVPIIRHAVGNRYQINHLFMSYICPTVNADRYTCSQSQRIQHLRPYGLHPLRKLSAHLPALRWGIERLPKGIQHALEDG